MTIKVWEFTALVTNWKKGESCFLSFLPDWTQQEHSWISVRSSKTVSAVLRNNNTGQIRGVERVNIVGTVGSTPKHLGKTGLETEQ